MSKERCQHIGGKELSQSCRRAETGEKPEQTGDVAGLQCFFLDQGLAEGLAQQHLREQRDGGGQGDQAVTVRAQKPGQQEHHHKGDALGRRTFDRAPEQSQRGFPMAAMAR